jgi:putative ABC transport system permease protein
VKVLAAWIRVALVDLRGDLRRFGVLLACLALGVATIALVGSVGAALQTALNRDARLLLGGDIEAGLSYRAAEQAERAVFSRFGTVAEVIEVMGDARNDAGEQAFLSLRAVDANYPLVGEVVVGEPQTPNAALSNLLAQRDGAWGAVTKTLLLDRLGISVGDRFTINETVFELRGILDEVPDQVTQGLQFGVPTLVSLEALNATGILEPGVLARYRYKIELADPAAFENPAAALRAAMEEVAPRAGWDVNSPQDATADLARFFGIFSRFLTIVGLSALIVGGVGVSNAVAAYVTERQRSIATLKALGATSARILTHFLTQVIVLTVVGILFGLVLGAIITIIALPIVGNLLSIELPVIVDPLSMVIASGFGMLVGFAFAFLPLKRAEQMRPALLFRATGAAIEGGLGWRQIFAPGLVVPLLLAIAAIYGLALLTTNRPELVFWYAVGVFASFIVLRAAAWGLQKLLKLVPPLPEASLRNALKSIYRPGAPAPIVILSLGLGLALLLLIALIDNNLRHQLDREQVPPDAPSFVFMDLFDDEVAMLEELATGEPRIEAFEPMAMLRGAMISINGTAVTDIPPPSEEMAMAFEGGEFPLTASGPLPERSTVIAGEWWAEDHAGEPLVSVYYEMADAMDIKLGDEVGFRVYGEEFTARVANLRDINWRGGGVSFAFVFTPNILERFPVSYIGLLRTVPGAERDLQRELVEQYPDLAFFPVAEALDVFSRILDAITNAVAVIGGLAVVSGLLVLAGAMAAGRRQREADAVVMKVLGATRGDVVRAFVVEYGVLGALAAVIAAGLSIVGAWAFVELILEIDFNVNPLVIVAVIVAAVALTIAVGIATTWSALSVKPAKFLREE